MNGELADLICLTTHGNKYLLGKKEEKAPDLLNGNTTFKFAKSIRFLYLKEEQGNIKEELVGETADEWFRYLKKTGVKGLKLVAIDYGDERPPELADYIAVAFANCANWAILAESDDDSRIWVVRENPAEDPDEESQRIWDINVMAYAVTVSFRSQPGSMEVAEKALREALVDIERFSKGTGEVKEWASWFSDALKALDSKSPSMKYFSDMLPEGWTSARARRLMAAAQRSWVFGGMCSWNDVYFEKETTQKEYLRVSDGLYKAMIDAFIIAANEVPEK
jgi:hypothetical protein